MARVLYGHAIYWHASRCISHVQANGQPFAQEELEQVTWQMVAGSIRHCVPVGERHKKTAHQLRTLSGSGQRLVASSGLMILFIVVHGG